MNPKTSIALAASGYFVMAVVVLVNLAIPNRDPYVEAWGGPLFMACVAFALLTFKLPLLTTSVGSIVFVVTFFKFVGGSLQSGEAAHNPVGFAIASRWYRPIWRFPWSRGLRYRSGPASLR